MPSNKNTRAAVPFVNQKGERSMKRVKVERYVAGKKPSYAKNEDEDEYYTTDEEEEDEELGDDSKDEDRQEKEEEGVDVGEVSDVKEVQHEEQKDDEDEEDDDPRFRRLKEIESKTRSIPILPPPKLEENVVMVDDDEDEEEVRERHRLARARRIEEPLQPQVALGSVSTDDRQNDINDAFYKPRKEQTEDILKDFKLEGIRPVINKKRDEAAAEEKFKDMIENARQQAIFQAQLHKKIEEDRKRELEKETLSKGGLTGKDLETVNTDDEDEELAYAEWQFREIKRVLRDKAERERESETKVG